MQTWTQHLKRKLEHSNLRISLLITQQWREHDQTSTIYLRSVSISIIHLATKVETKDASPSLWGVVDQHRHWPSQLFTNPAPAAKEALPPPIPIWGFWTSTANEASCAVWEPLGRSDQGVTSSLDRADNDFVINFRSIVKERNQLIMTWDVFYKCMYNCWLRCSFTTVYTRQNNAVSIGLNRTHRTWGQAPYTYGTWAQGYKLWPRTMLQQPVGMSLIPVPFPSIDSHQGQS